MSHDPVAPPRRTLLILLALDAALIAAHLGFTAREALDPAAAMPASFDVGGDRSISEVLNWGKWAGAAAALAALARWRSSGVAAAFALAFALIAADDALRLHERGGRALAERLGLEGAGGLRAQDLGELLTWAMLGTVIVAALARAFWRADVAGRRLGLRLLSLLGALILCAVVVDMIHVLGMEQQVANHVLTVLEDGGEMVVGSLCLAFCLARLPAARPRSP